jgi:hypothetical protein
MKYKLTIKNAIESPLKVFVPPQLKSLFELFTFVSERNIKYQYIILACSLNVITIYFIYCTKFDIYLFFFYYYHWVDISAGGLLVPKGIIRPVVSALTLTWLIRYIYY